MDFCRGFLSMTLGLAVVLGGASAAKADSPGDVPRSSLAPADYNTVKYLHALSELAISAGQIAQTNGGSQAVRDFGAKLVSDHTAGDEQLLAYAKKAGIDPNRMKNQPPPAAIKAYMQRLDTLRTLHGQQFDHQFTATIRDASAQTIGYIHQTLPVISDSDLTALLNKRLPTINQNYETASRLASQRAPSSSEQQPPPNTTSTGQGQPPAPHPAP
jgi:predicted outer membrane protein